MSCRNIKTKNNVNETECEKRESDLVDHTQTELKRTNTSSKTTSLSQSEKGKEIVWNGQHNSDGRDNYQRDYCSCFRRRSEVNTREVDQG